MKSILYHSYNPNSLSEDSSDELYCFLDTIKYEVGNKILLLGNIGNLGNRLRMLGVYVTIIEDSNYGDICHSLIKNTNCSVIKGRLELLPFEEEYFDKVIILDEFNNINNCKTATKEIQRVLKSDGEVIIEDLNLKNIKVKMKKLKCKMFGEKNNYHYPEEVMDLFLEVGFSGKVKEIENERYIYIGKKNTAV